MFEDFENFEFQKQYEKHYKHKRTSIIDNIIHGFKHIGTICTDIKWELCHLKHKTKKFLGKTAGTCYNFVIIYLVIQALVFISLIVLAFCGVNVTWYSTISSYLPAPLQITQNGWHGVLFVALWITLLKGLSTLKNIQEYGGWRSQLLFPIATCYFIYSMFNYNIFIQTATWTLVGCFLMNWFIYIGPWSGGGVSIPITSSRGGGSSKDDEDDEDNKHGTTIHTQTTPSIPDGTCKIKEAYQSGDTVRVNAVRYFNGSPNNYSWSTRGYLVSFSETMVVLRDQDLQYVCDAKGNRGSGRPIR